MSRAEFKKRHTADPADLRAGEAFAQGVQPEGGGRSEAGVAADSAVDGNGGGHPEGFWRGAGAEVDRRGGVPGARRRDSPAGIADRVVVAVLGLDNRPQAKPHFRMRGAAAGRSAAEAAAAPASYTPPQVARRTSGRPRERSGTDDRDYRAGRRIPAGRS